MVFVIVRNKVLAENKKSFIEAAMKHAARSLERDKGLISFEIGEKEGDATEILFLERWETLENLQSHAERGKTDEILQAVNALRISREMETYTN